MVPRPDASLAEPAGTSSRPLVSVIVPLYESQGTLPGFLRTLATQTYAPFEVVLVDSSPSDACVPLVRELAPDAVSIRSAERLFPHAARSVGVRRARGSLLVFTDPDVLPAPDWLERLVEAHLATGHVVVGSLACHGDRWLDRGIHLTKFSKWLPGGAPRPVDMAPTANVLVPRALFEGIGGFGPEPWQGDTLLSWRLRRLGTTLWLEPRAVVAHHHVETLGGFLAERLGRGPEYGRVRIAWILGGAATSLVYLLVTLLPVRILTNLGHVARHAARSRQLATFLATFPVVFLGHSASLLGEAWAYAGRLLGGGRDEAQPLARTSGSQPGA